MRFFMNVGTRGNPADKTTQRRLLLVARTSEGPRMWSVPWGRWRVDPRRPLWMVRRVPARVYRWLPW